MIRSLSGSFFPTLVFKRNAGHSKWANIKHTKDLKDSQRAKLFSRLCQRMKVAIHEGGNADPDKNLQLAQAIEVAKKQNMPVASIESCIKAAQADKLQGRSAWYEIKGVNGCFIIASAFTDNPRRTRETITPILKKYHGMLAERSAKNIFQQKGEIHAMPPSTVGDSDEVTVEHAIESGAEEVFPSEIDEGAYVFICEPECLHQVRGKLQRLEYTIRSADFNFIPTFKVELSDIDLEKMSKLIDRLEEHPDIVKLYDNIA